MTVNDIWLLGPDQSKNGNNDGRPAPLSVDVEDVTRNASCDKKLNRGRRGRKQKTETELKRSLPLEMSSNPLEGNSLINIRNKVENSTGHDQNKYGATKEDTGQRERDQYESLNETRSIYRNSSIPRTKNPLNALLIRQEVTPE